MELQSKQLSTKGPAGMFSGDVYFDVTAKGEEPSRMRVNTVRFAPCARTASHAHAVGQRRSTSPRASGWSSPAAVSRGRVPPRTRGSPRPNGASTSPTTSTARRRRPERPEVNEPVVVPRRESPRNVRRGCMKLGMVHLPNQPVRRPSIWVNRTIPTFVSNCGHLVDI
jgi:hypothetical protein